MTDQCECAIPGDVIGWRGIRRQVLSHQLSQVGYVPMMILAIHAQRRHVLAPIMWTILDFAAYRRTDSFTVPPKWLPTDLAWEKLCGRSLRPCPSPDRFINSTIITWGTVLGPTDLQHRLAGYAFARLEFKGRDLLFWVVLATMMIPIQATVIPVFIFLVRSLGLFDTALVADPTRLYADGIRRLLAAAVLS